MNSWVPSTVRTRPNALAQQGLAPDQVNQVLQEAVGAAHAHVNEQGSGLPGDHMGRNVFAAFAAGLVKGDGFFGSIKDGLEGGIGGRLSESLAGKVGLDPSTTSGGRRGRDPVSDELPEPEARRLSVRAGGYRDRGRRMTNVVLPSAE